MYTLRKWMLAGLVAALWVGPALTADDDQHLIATEDTVELMLLRQKSVQHELKLGDEQGKRVHEFTSEQWKKAQHLAKADKGEREKKFEEMGKENEKFLKDTLTPAQRKRLQQITMQRAGLLWIARSDVARELGLSADQKEKVKELHKEARKEAVAVLREHEGKEVKREKMREMRMKNRQRLLTLLTEDQKRKWNEMKGDEFRGELHFGPAGKD